MPKTWAKAPSPCIDVCKFRDNGACIGCAMSRREKKNWKRLDGKAEKKAFLHVLLARLDANGRAAYWTRMYRRRCERKGRPCPLDKLDPPAAAQSIRRAAA